MNANVRAKRILSRLASYHSIEDVGGGFGRLREQAIRLGAKPIGVYVNTQTEGSETLLVTDLGVLLENKLDVAFIAYKNVGRVDIVASNTLLEEDSSKKSEADGLLISTLDTGSSQLIPIRNGNGKYRDVFEFARFMLRTAEDAKMPRGTGVEYV